MSAGTIHQPDWAAQAKAAVLRVGKGGRGFVVEINHARLVITASHCLSEWVLPTHPGMHYWEKTKKLLGRLGKLRR
jgi:hypothetical protein